MLATPLIRPHLWATLAHAAARQRILTRHLLDQRNRFCGQTLGLRLLRPARLQSPEQPKTLSVPAQQRVRLDNLQDLLLIGAQRARNNSDIRLEG